MTVAWNPENPTAGGRPLRNQIGRIRPTPFNTVCWVQERRYLRNLDFLNQPVL